jgi:non-heme chloroperoxidase
MRAGVLADRSQILQGLERSRSTARTGRREGVAGVARHVLAAGMQAGFKASSTASRHSRRPTHRRPEEDRRADADHARRRGSDRSDEASAKLSAKLVKRSTLKVYPGLSHGMCTVNRIRSTLTCWRSSGPRARGGGRHVSRHERPLRSFQRRDRRGSQRFPYSVNT